MHDEATLAQFASKLFRKRAEIGDRLRDVGDALGLPGLRFRVLRSVSLQRVGLQGIQRELDVVREIVERIEARLVEGVACGRGKPEFARVLILAQCIELVAQHGLQRRRKLVQRHRGLHDLEQPRLVLKANAAGQFGAATEFLDFAQTRLRFEIARRHDRQQQRRLQQLVLQRVLQIVVARERRIAPDGRILAEQLAQTNLERLMEHFYPAALSLEHRLVVEVGVADEDVTFTIANVAHVWTVRVRPRGEREAKA